MDAESIFPRVVFTLGGLEIRDSVVVTWVLMLALAAGGWWATRRLQDRPGPVQNAAEAGLELLEALIGELSHHPAGTFLPFVGTLALYLGACNLVSLLPGVSAPTRDLNTAFALALVVFGSVHYFGWRLVGPKAYLRSYVEPYWPLLPFNILGELSRTIALALRLFGNMMSGDLVIAVLMLLAGLLVPVLMQLFGLLIGFIQAYVFTLLAMVYIGAAIQTKTPEPGEGET